MLKQVVNKTKTLNPQIIKQFKLDDDIEIIDNLMNDINNMLKKQEKTSKKKMLLVLSSNGIKNKYNGHIFCIDTGMSKAFQQMPNNETTVHYLEVINNKIKLH